MIVRPGRRPYQESHQCSRIPLDVVGSATSVLPRGMPPSDLFSVKHGGTSAEFAGHGSESKNRRSAPFLSSSDPIERRLVPLFRQLLVHAPMTLAFPSTH